MKFFLISIGALIILGVISYEPVMRLIASHNVIEPENAINLPSNGSSNSVPVSKSAGETEKIPDQEIVAENLTIPWDIVFLPDGGLLTTLRNGAIVRLDENAREVATIEVPSVLHTGEGGLLGMALHPEFEENRYLYLYLTSNLEDGDNVSVNEVIRYRFENDTLTEPTEILGNIPGSLYHNGGRIAFGPDGYLYITTGDARVSENAQNLDSLAGKILRVTDEGAVPADNPFPGSAIYAYGSRNSQGLTWDREGNLWSTEHGRTNATQTGMDELNLIVPGGNYGWPESEGDTVKEGTIGPKLHSGPSRTWAPASALYYDGSVFWGGLRGEALYEAVLEGTEVVELREHFKGEFGRIRSVVLGPDGAFYLTTSNRDARGDIAPGDDKIIRLNPEQFRRD